MTVRVQKWGNSLGVRIPKDIARRTKIREGSELEISCERGGVTMRPVKIPSLKELLAGVKAGDRPKLVEWGGRVGKEVW